MRLGNFRLLILLLVACLYSRIAPIHANDDDDDDFNRSIVSDIKTLSFTDNFEFTLVSGGCKHEKLCLTKVSKAGKSESEELHLQGEHRLKIWE